MKSLYLWIGLVSFTLPVFSAADPKPKYGPEALLLSRSHEYIRESRAPDFWTLVPYYVAQRDDRSCSVASVAMVVNASRSGRKLTADDELATQSGLLKRVSAENWPKLVGPAGHGVTLDQLKPILESSLKAYGVSVKSTQVVHATEPGKPDREFKEKLHRALIENEKSDRDYIVINFNQQVFTGDADVGHIAPLAAYDAKRKQALVFDPDRQWYEPYWVSEATLARGMETMDRESGKPRGFIWVQVER